MKGREEDIILSGPPCRERIRNTRVAIFKYLTLNTYSVSTFDLRLLLDSLVKFFSFEVILLFLGGYFFHYLEMMF